MIFAISLAAVTLSILPYFFFGILVVIVDVYMLGTTWNRFYWKVAMILDEDKGILANLIGTSYEEVIKECMKKSC